jgi:hypothetical protein
MTQSLTVTPGHKTAKLWLVAFALIGIALVFLYADADQQDAGYHYLFARWSWEEPFYLIGVWARPLFTLAYSVPAQLGYPAAKLFTLLIALVTAWQTYRLAIRLQIDRAHLTIPILVLQPAYFLLFTETQTEPLFALLVVIALRLWYADRIRAAMIVASMLILIRPEGFFIGVAWGVLVLQTSAERRILRRLIQPLWLGTGVLLWWVVSLAVSRDALWIVHDWPKDWLPMSEANGRGPLLWYVIMLPLIVGPLFLPQFVVGLWRLLRSREFLIGTISFVTLFATHSLMFWRGWFGAAGYPRYLVCVAPVTAIITLYGWNQVQALTGPRFAKIVIAGAFVLSLFYVDGYRFSRDARAVDDAAEWLEANPVQYKRLIYSQSYMCIRLGCSNADRGRMTAERARNVELLRSMPEGTLVFWDGEVGPKWYRLTASDIQDLGYRQVFSKSYRLEGYFFRVPWKFHGGPRSQAMQLLVK